MFDYINKFYTRRNYTMATVVNKINESEILSMISQACMNNSYWEGKIAFKAADESDQNINLISSDSIDYTEPLLGSVILAIASTLGKIKDSKKKKVLSFVDNVGTFICAFWIEYDGEGDDGDYIAGAYFDQEDLKKIPDKDIKPHTEVPFFYLQPDSDVQKFIGDATNTSLAQDATIINRLIIECLIALRFYMTVNATEEGFEFNMIQTINKDICAPELAVALGESETLDIAKVKSQKTKNGCDIAFEFGQNAKFYIKDHTDVAAMVE